YTHCGRVGTSTTSVGLKITKRLCEMQASNCCQWKDSCGCHLLSVPIHASSRYSKQASECFVSNDGSLRVHGCSLQPNARELIFFLFRKLANHDVPPIVQLMVVLARGDYGLPVGEFILEDQG